MISRTCTYNILTSNKKLNVQSGKPDSGAFAMTRPFLSNMLMTPRSKAPPIFLVAWRIVRSPSFLFFANMSTMTATRPLKKLTRHKAVPLFCKNKIPSKITETSCNDLEDQLLLNCVSRSGKHRLDLGEGQVKEHITEKKWRKKYLAPQDSNSCPVVDHEIDALPLCCERSQRIRFRTGSNWYWTR